MNQELTKKEHFESGKLKAEYEYHENGNLKQELQYYENGNLKSERPFDENGLVNGVSRTWCENGQKRFEIHMVNGFNHGPWLVWNSEGVLSEEKNFIYGEEDGISRYIDKNGKERHEYYSMGTPIIFKSDQAKLMADFLQNLGFKIESPPQVQNKKIKKKENIL